MFSQLQSRKRGEDMKIDENLFFCGFTIDHCISKTMKTALGKRFNSRDGDLNAQ